MSASPSIPRSAVTVPVSLPKAAPGARRVRYWMGTMPHSPIQNLSAGGQTFSRFRGNPVFDGPNNAPNQELRFGIHVPLTEEQVALVQAGVRIRIVRIESSSDDMDEYENVPDMTPQRKKKVRARVHMIDSKNYVPQHGDRPFAEFVYMHRLDQMSADGLTSFPPHSMAGEVESKKVAKPVTA